ncbi:MAG TPA: single-stranded-DNA-specific exonuclease RecJ [Terriglobales bacterium]|nr:single-stranded-DNA-specific exonuclease RecJ [Terriglobales bacterium]
MKFRWTLAPAQPLLAGQLAHQLKLSPLLAKCLLNRDLCAPDAITGFLEPRLKNLRDPFLLPDMDRAVTRLLRAREQSETVVIFGDYDVDGVTSTALLLVFLRALGFRVDCYLPSRMDEGYGLSQEAVENCLRRYPARVLLAVDCGSSTVSSIEWLKEQGVDVIVLDHHQLSSPPPRPSAMVNPRNVSPAPALIANGAQQNGEPPFAELCSAGLAFKLAHAILKRARENNLPGAGEFDLRPLLDLVALGTIADLVPLTSENRILVTAGLHRLKITSRPGIVALKQVAQCPADLGTYEVGFQLAPRLNAAGRLETAEAALNLLLAPDLMTAMPLARQLDSCNRERQTLERAIALEAIEAVRSHFHAENDFVIVEGREPWHIGVVGIVASRVLQQFYRPTIIVGGDGEFMRGSGRSISGFNLAEALRECDDLLVRHGGHAMAAGLTITPGKLELFRERLNGVARRALKPDHLQPGLRLDAEVGLDELTLERINELGHLNPVGLGNPAVQFCARNLAHARPLQRVGAEKQHVKMWLADERNTVEAVWWGAGAEALPVGRFDVAFAPQTNEYNGRRTVQLKVLDWRPADKSGPSLSGI